MSALTESLAPDRLRPWHELVIDMWVANPNLTQRQIAHSLGRSEYWLSIVVNCDAFQLRLAERKAEIIDPILAATVEDRLRAVVNKSAEKFLDRLASNAPISDANLIRAMQVGAMGLGMGPASKSPAIQQNLYVIPAPPRAADSATWAQQARGEIIDVPEAP